VDERLRDEIERYLDGGMAADEAARFLDAVRQDPGALSTLGRSLEQQADLFDSVHEARPARARRRARRLGPAPAPFGWFAAAVAAAALVLVVAAASTSPRPTRRSPAPTAALEQEPVLPPAPEPPAPARVPEPPRSRPEAPTPPPPEAPVPPPSSRESAPPPTPPALPAPSISPPRETVPAARPAVARLAEVSGRVTVEGAPAGKGSAVSAGDTVEIGAPDGSASLAYEDGTRLEIRPGSVFRAEGGPAKRITLRGGALSADVVGQPQDRPMVFATPQVEVAVLGTRLSLAVSSESSHVEVREGRVRMTRLTDRSWVDVRSGFQATAVRGRDLSARPLPVEEILLVPQQAVVTGGDWRAVRDPEASTGVALEAPRFHRQLLQNYADAPRVTFTFRAESDRDYHLWVRGRTTAPRDLMEHDAVIVEIPGAILAEQPGPNRGLAGGPNRALVNGYMHRAGYWWVGGDADGGGDATPISVRFARPGVQTLRLFTYESPVRIDAVWLSAFQKSRPDAGRSGPR